MTAPRCTRCFGRLSDNPYEVHLCPADQPEKKPRKPKDPRPSSSIRRNRNPLDRESYLAEVRAGHGTRTCAKRKCDRPECKEARNAYMRAWRAKRRASA